MPALRRERFVFCSQNPPGRSAVVVILTYRLGATDAGTVAGRAAAFGVSFWWAIGFAVLAAVPAFLLPATTGRRSVSPQVPA